MSLHCIDARLPAAILRGHVTSITTRVRPNAPPTLALGRRGGAGALCMAARTFGLRLKVQCSGGFGGGAPAAKPKKGGKGKAKGASKPAAEPLEGQCPCGLRKTYDACCGVYHRGEAVEPTAEAVLRARFSAYVKNEPAYVVSSTHPDSADMHRRDEEGPEACAAQLLKDVEATIKITKFVKLSAVKADAIGADDQETSVTFRAGFQTQASGKHKVKYGEVLSEKARFARHGERWMYKSSTALNDAAY